MKNVVILIISTIVMIIALATMTHFINSVSFIGSFLDFGTNNFGQITINNIDANIYSAKLAASFYAAICGIIFTVSVGYVFIYGYTVIIAGRNRIREADKKLIEQNNNQ